MTQSLEGDGTVIARVASTTNTSTYAKAGIMIKDKLVANSNYAAAFVYPSGGTRFQYNYVSSVTGPTLTFPNVWLKLTRSGSTVTTYSSPNGSTWTQIGSTTITLRNTAQIGLFVTSNNTSATNTATFDNVSITKTTTLPSGWTNGDVGNPSLAGSSSYSNGTYTVNGAGTDVWNSDDQFQTAYQTLTGNGEIVARVTSQTNTHEWAKAGIVIKASPNSGTNYASIHTTPNNGIRMQWNYTNDISGGSYTFPNVWLKLNRTGNTITTYKSTNGTSWTQVGSTTVTLPTTATIGLYVNSVNASTLGTAVFDNVTITPTSTSSTTYKYGYTSGSDTPDLLLDNAGAVVEKYLQLPGGVTKTYRSGSTRVFSLPNLHGDVFATTNEAGTQTGTFTYDPFGNKAGSSLPDNTAANSTFGWVGQHEKTTETNFALAPTQMGARVYLPTLGRFTSVDPIPGGCANAYVYVHGDPVNSFDLTGTKTDCSKLARTINSVRNELEKRYSDIRNDKLRLPLFGRMSVKGHQNKFIDRQRNLRKNLEKWQDDGCNNTPGGPRISGDSWKWATRKAPQPDSYSIPWGKVGVSVGVGVVVAAGLVFAPEVTVPALVGGGARYAQYAH